MWAWGWFEEIGNMVQVRMVSVGESHLEKGVNLEKRLEKINFKEGFA